jgi:glycosyltransferase involved in cell wall biosynthesis
MSGPLEPPLRIVQVTKHQVGGGAERVAASLHEGMIARGHRSWMAVRRPRGDDPTILRIPARRSGLAHRGQRRLRRVADLIGPRGSGQVRESIGDALRAATAPRRAIARARGREWFDYPGTASIPGLPPEAPDIVHLHNLHGDHFDLRQLAPMSQRLPVAMTLHDEWTFTGHCAYGIDCERWRFGCGSCPDLRRYPAIARDGTRANWKAKRAIYERASVYVSTPSRWLMDRAQASMLAAGAAGWRVIHNGVDRAVFRPADRAAARARLGLPPEPVILLFTANQARSSPYKDWRTIRHAAGRAARLFTSRPILCVALGEDGPSERFDNGELRFLPYREDRAEVAAFYAAADLYLHAARAENFPTTILEAMSSGLPVVATAVGGIPEQIRSLTGITGAWAGAASGIDVATGVLVEPGDAEAMAVATASLLGDDGLRANLGTNAAADAGQRFDLERQLDATLDWYRSVIADRAARHASSGS